jgi:hypothetical protein
MISKQEMWTKLIMHGVNTHQLPDSEEEMKGLQRELETSHKGF